MKFNGTLNGVNGGRAGAKPASQLAIRNDDNIIAKSRALPAISRRTVVSRGQGK